jgi:hypothetical protein
MAANLALPLPEEIAQVTEIQRFPQELQVGMRIA